MHAAGFKPALGMLAAAALLLGLAACDDAFEPTTARGICAGDFTPITVVQGHGPTSPLVAETVNVSGLVTRVEPGRGFYVEAPGATAHDASAALFVEYPGAARVSTGDVLVIAGRVAEIGSGSDTLTSLVESSLVEKCAEGSELPVHGVDLPLDAQQRESLEGMRVALPAGLVVSDTYRMRNGEWTLSAGGPLRVPTEDSQPGKPALAAASDNLARSLSIALAGDDPPALPAGTVVGPLMGVLGNDGKAQRLEAEQLPESFPGSPVPLEPVAAGQLRIVGANLLNFFNGDGRGGGFPTERGARTAKEFEAQKARTQAAIARLQPQLLAVQELENDGFDEDSAARSLLQLLNTSGHADWQVVDPGFGPIGGDVITVGLFYRAEVLEAIGGPQLLDGPAFNRLSRLPLAHLFRHRGSGETLLVAVNHLKSKGRCPESGPNADQGDGQGCWNRARIDAVEALAPWLHSLASELGTPNTLILGDMNAWRHEDPIEAFRQAGYVELVETLSGLPQYSFLYFGQRGTLDYAFASPDLAAHAMHAEIPHINADWPQGMALPEPWLRMSDHDPVVIDFDFSQEATSD